MLYRFNLMLACALALVLVLLALMQVDYSRPNYQVNLGDDMTYSPAYSSFEPNSNFANGRTLQDPVPGTIARGAQLFHFEPTPEDAIRAGEQLVNPFDANTEEGVASADRGADVFKVFCVACHNADGTGMGPVAMRGFPPPPSLLTGKSREMKDGQLLHILTYGQNSMPQFAAQLPPNSRWDVINYIRRLQKAESEKAESEKSKTENQAENQEPVADNQPQPPEKEETPPEKAESPPEKAEEPPKEEPKPAEGEQQPVEKKEEAQESTPGSEASKILQPDSVEPAEAQTETNP